MKLKPIDKNLILERMRFDNPWWITSSIYDEFNEMQRRLYFKNLIPLIEDKEIKRAVVLMGPRRVGKTVMIHHTIEYLLKHKINKYKICYLGIDNPLYLNMSLDELFKLVRNAVGDSNPDDWYVFFDEIQYLKNWEIHLKVMVESYPHTKFIVSGSAAAALKIKSIESGAGRFTEFMLPPLTFQEYLHLLNYNDLMRPTKTNWKGDLTKFYKTINIKELNKHFLDYINFGGYPEVIFSKKIQSNLSRYIRADIIDKVLLRDLPSLYGIQDVPELNSFFTTLAYYCGSEVSLDTLSKNSGVEKNLLKKYLEYLEAAFLIRVIHRVDDNAKHFKRATFYKVYLTNPSLRSALFSPLAATDEQMGNMVETTVFSQWFYQNLINPMYARWNNGRLQGEVDMVVLNENTLKPRWALEIKWSNRYANNPNELKSLFQFCKNNKLESALVTTIDQEKIININDIELFFYPASVYSYSVGVNVIQQKI